METTLVGIIKVDPKQLLVDGIRKELVRQIAGSMHAALQFDDKHRTMDFENKLTQLSVRLAGYKRSFQYIQDYVNVQGLKIWQEEFSRIVNFNIEQECNTFLKKKVFAWQSKYQDPAIPVPVFTPIGGAATFIGRLANEILAQTDPRETIYLDQMAGWYDAHGRENLGIKSFELLLDSVGVFGVSGLDRLFSFKIVRGLQDFVARTRAVVKQNRLGELVAGVSGELLPTNTIPTDTVKLYATALKKTASLWPVFLDAVSSIGQMQLLRRQIANVLNYSCKLDSNSLFSTLSVLNKSLIKDIQAHYLNPDSNPYPDPENPLLFEMTNYLEAVGVNDPYTKIYITTKPLDEFALLMFLFVVSQAGKFVYNSNISALVAKKGEKQGVDGVPFVVGVITLLKQFHSVHTHTFLAYLGQYIRGFLNISLQRESKLADYPAEAQSVLLFLEEFCKFSYFSRKAVEGYFPAYIFDNFK